MRTVLGLSVTSDGIAWALVDGDRADATPLDDDAFDVDAADQLAPRAASAVRSAQAIAASSGQDVVSVGVYAVGLGSDDAGDDRLIRLRDLLAAAGFDDVRVVTAPSDATDLEDSGTQARLRAARSAAFAVATNAVPRTPRPVAARAPVARRYTAVRAAAAAAAAIATGLLTVGSQYVEPLPGPAAAADGDVSAAAEPRMVTVAAPRLTDRAVTTPAEEPVSVQVAERASRVPVDEPDAPAVPAPVVPAEQVVPGQRAQAVVMVQTAVPQAVPMVQTAIPAQAPVLPNMPIQQPAGVPAAHLPAVEQHLPTADAHVAADPSPGPMLTAPAPAAAQGPMPVPAPAPLPAPVTDPVSGWLLAAMP